MYPPYDCVATLDPVSTRLGEPRIPSPKYYTERPHGLLAGITHTWAAVAHDNDVAASKQKQKRLTSYW
jgi:hypothetical protein